MKAVGVRGDPNLAAVQAALTALGDLRDAVVLVGGCATRLLGRSDPLLSHDLEDVIALLDGRHELEQEITAAPADIQGAIREQARELLADARLVETIAGFLPGDAASQARLPQLHDRLKRLAD